MYRQKNPLARLGPETDFVTQAQPAGTAVNGKPVDLRSIAADGVSALFAAHANLDAADTLTVSNVKIQSSADSAFTAPVDEAVASADMVLTGATGDSNVDHHGQAVLHLDLARVPATRPWLRLTATPTLSDTATTTGGVAGILVFAGTRAGNPG